MNARIWTIPLALSIAVGGCGDMLTETPESFVTTDTYYETPDDIESATLSMYTQFYDWSMFKIMHVWMTELGSDQSRVNPDEPNWGTSHPDFLGWTEGDWSVYAPWRMHYMTILRANLVIARAPDVEFQNEQRRTELVAEAKFMRAFSYFWLARFYGGVPLMLSEEDHAATDPERASEAEVLNQIVADASAAAQDLPVTRSGEDVGRATVGAALMLLADAHLWQENWQEAADAAQAVMDLGVHALEDNYINAFLPEHKNGPEEIFSIQATGTNGRTSTCYACSYFPRELGFEQGGGWGVVQPTPWHYDSYITGDYRQEVSFRTEGCSQNPEIGCIELSYPHVWKYRPSNGGVPQWDGDVNMPIYRYAETLLIYAEAQNELGSPDVAVQYLNMVRARARQGTGSESRTEPADYTGPTDQASVRDAIFMERNWELSHEMKRWFDLVRRGPDYFVSQLEAHDKNARESGNISPHRMRLPIPQGEMDINGNLDQNPGY